MKRLTIRGRLTLAFTTLFTVAGVVLLAITYYLVDRQLPAPITIKGASIPGPDPGPGKGFLDSPTQDRIFTFVQKQAEGYRDTTLTTLLTQGAIALALILLASAVISWLIAGRILQPLHRMTDAATRVARADSAGGGLHERIALDGPHDEVRRLADAFDLMLARLDQAFDGQRRFVANASHELRTPLALNRALVELAITRPGVSDDAHRLGESLLKVNERHERLIEGLLMLADSETELATKEQVDLAEIARHILGPVERASSALAPAPTVGDPVLLERLVQNLVENAVKHNVADGGWVRVETATVDGQARLVVTNTGPVVPAYEMETIFQPFRRLGRERVGGVTRGFGLGLSIVRAIARAHGGTVQAAPRPGGGLTVTVAL
ncbi:signal transduction histidine kinase [Allocatelliglobosispora scoriae]|uniref:histidine kinase n=1 Tax=Allocatelliglobosispora scoriae TaxID=643052 RepID=A0A841BR32_9ACTN|nr:HAMP domain-containing sensor histidine kinase [Allocatelliglobosispora scoriae]MBB5870694.1 signal transduction histidine kinase [Allocatelliglobosispora scoriae]